MSLLATRPPAAMERASVVLPTVKCSSCASEIPLNSLGEHVCHPMPAMPSPRPAQSPLGGGHGSRPSVNSGRLQRPNAPSNLRNERSGDSSSLGPIYSDYAPHKLADVPPPISTPSPRFPSENPMPSPTLSTMPDTTSGGNAGMAGVGRRAFAAAAWGVRAGVALAAGSGRGFNPDGDEAESSYSRSPTTPPLDSSPPFPAPKPFAHERTGSSLRSAGPLNAATGTGPIARIGREPSHKEPVILPKAPLAERARAPDAFHNVHGRDQSRDGAMSRADSYGRPGASSRNDDYRSASRNDLRAGAGSRADDYRSASRAGGSRSGSRADDRSARADEARARAASRAQLERSASSQSCEGDKSRPFFDKYHALMGSKSDQTHTRSPVYDDNISLSSDNETSSLPWATRSDDGDDISDDPFQRIEVNHQRYPTDGSIESHASSYYPSPDGYSSHENEMVMTPSQSWEGLSAVHSGAVKTPYYESPASNNDLGLPNLAEVEEDEDEDEGEAMVFGVPSPMRKDRMPRSSSASTVTPANAYRSPAKTNLDLDLDPPRIPQSFAPTRSRTEPAMSTSPPTGARPKRVCASCGDAVGGSRRYVERDGVVLCEADWKKMYLPACRRCKLPIEKSAVSSSDGQLKGKWHRACFTCTRCDSPFDGDDFYVHRGRPWCQFHYAEEAGTLCASASCRKPIEGACILAPSPAGDQRFHPGHLRCDHRGGVSGAQSCRESMAEYFDVAGQRFCERHVGEAVRRAAQANGGGGTMRAEKRRTKLIDMPTASALRL